MKILLISPEAGELSSLTPVANVVNNLAMAYEELGHEVRLFSPFYQKQLNGETSFRTTFQGDDRIFKSPFSVIQNKKSLFYYVKKDIYFNRERLYDENQTMYEDNADRFSFLGSAILSYCIENDFIPELINCHEWGSSFAISYLKNQFKDFFPKSKVFFTIHNIYFDYLITNNYVKKLYLNPDHYSFEGYEYWGKVSLLKMGIIYSDKVILTSREYKENILVGNISESGMHAFLETYTHKIEGIQNGINYKQWNRKNKNKHYHSAENAASRLKSRNRSLIQKLVGLPEKDTFILLSLADPNNSSGTEILSTILSNILMMDVQIVIGISESQPEYNYFKSVNKLHPHKFGIIDASSDETLQSILGGADALCICNRTDISGDLILKGLEYGIIPICSSMGVEKDNLTSFFDDEKKANSFICSEPSPDHLLRILRKCIEIKATDISRWEKMIANAYKINVAWNDTVANYLKIV